MEAIQVFKVGFDYLENNSANAIYKTLLGTFINKDGLTAIGNANKFLESHPIGIVRICYDGNVYPYIEFKKINIE